MIKENYYTIIEEIDKIKNRLHITYPVRIMGVSKTQPLDEILEALEAGVTLFGENKLQEAYSKFTDPLLEGKEYDLHFIGNLQRNKVAKAVEIAKTIQSIDRIEILDKMEKECQKLNKKIDYLIQVNSSYEPQKHGLEPERFPAFLEEVMKKEYRFCVLRGLMTVGPLSEEEQDIRKAFRMVKNLFEQTKSGLKDPQFDTLSMGMSGDYPIAIEEGSTLVRIGSLIFGIRYYP